MRYPASRDVVAGAAGIGALALVIATLRSLQPEPNPTIAALLLLLVILVVATAVPVGLAVAFSVAATAAFNFFLLPPFHTFSLDDPQNWVALVVFLVVAVIASQLSAAVRRRAQEAVTRRDALARLFDLSRDVLLTSDSREAVDELARSAARRFGFQSLAIALPRGGTWEVHDGGAELAGLTDEALTRSFQSMQTSLEFDAGTRSYTSHRVIESGGRPCRLVPLRIGARPIGLLAAAGMAIEAGTLDALAALVALALERAHFLEERQEAEVTRRSEAVKTTLLASLGHDLRTPLTAIRVAADNIKASWATDADRVEQSDVILGEVERLSHLFQNIHDMARIDAGAIATEPRWTCPSEIVAAARDQTGRALLTRRVDVDIERDVPVWLDPRVTAIALAHLLENASKYSPKGTAIAVDARVTADRLIIAVRDHGPGIAPDDLPRVFDRFYRGASSPSHATGTGMGLWIARGLLAAEHGRLVAENCPDGGARFVITVPAAVQSAASEASPAR